jgi:hypothetical protein
MASDRKDRLLTTEREATEKGNQIYEVAPICFEADN